MTLHRNFLLMSLVRDDQEKGWANEETDLSHRTPAYVTCVILAAVILSIPQMISGMSYLQYFRRGTPFPLMSFGNHSPLQSSPFWDNKFWGIAYFNRVTLTQRDPETGISINSNIMIAGDQPGFHLTIYGNQLWLVGDQSSYQIIDGKAHKVIRNRSPQWVLDSQRFLLNGTLAEITNSRSGTGFTVTSLIANSWVATHEVDLPERSWMFGTIPISFASVMSIECVSEGDRLHCFARTHDRLLYREGLPLRPVGKFAREFADGPSSALEPANVDYERQRWSLVTESPSIGSQILTGGMLIEGRPAALIVDKLPNGHSTGKVYRFDGQAWSLFETVNFPFGGTYFRTVSRNDGERSYLLMTTATGRVYVFSASAAGVKQTFVDPVKPVDGFRTLQTFLVFPCLALVLAAIQAAITSAVMTASTHPDYGYGVQKVQLADVIRRGVARSIDLVLVTVLTCLFGRILTYGFDWASFGEAVTLQVSHPTIYQMVCIAIALFLWIGLLSLLLVFIQGKWGITPGKWCCGLRVFKTTLKPCGFIRSLTREVTLAFESCNLLCWAPGIAAIALTDHRQRLGDWAADTIVIRRPRGT